MSTQSAQKSRQTASKKPEPEPQPAFRFTDWAMI